MRDIVKRFGDVVASDGVSLELAEGEIHALLGENGAGKTTLMNVLFGMTQPDSGVIEIAGEMASLGGPSDAISAGIGMVHQHPLLVGPLSVAENMRLGGVGDGTAEGMRRAIAAVTETTPLNVDPDLRVDELPLSVRQRIEIVRCLARGVRILILDEPTAVLTPEEVELLFARLRELSARGCGVVLITHKLSEVGTLADRVTVLRRGAVVGSHRAGEVASPELARMMVGRDVGAPPQRPVAAPGEVRLTLEQCTVAGDDGPVLDNASLEVAGGEIVCLAGVEGNGQRPLAEVCFGMRTPDSGHVRIDGKVVPPIEDWRRQGIRIARVPEDRRHNGLIAAAPLWRNLLSGPMALREGGVVRKRAAVARAAELLEAHGVHPPDPNAPGEALSGGNQQKVVLARELATEPRALVAVNPTRGLDLGAQFDVYARLDALRASGVAVLVISTDLDEVLRLADRVGVLYRGQLGELRPRADVDRERLGMSMAGLDPEAAAKGDS